MEGRETADAAWGGRGAVKFRSSQVDLVETHA